MLTQSICSICGANYEYVAGRWKCPACGAYKQEELSNEEVTLLYNAAQKLRFSDFDEAEKAYADVIEQYPQNPEGYWGRLLSKYGIKYEEDFDGRKIPTCYATSIESVISDRDYSKAITLADEDTKAYYQKQAEYIERVRKEWVEKANKEEPYDIFISYKESDSDNGVERTQDSIDVMEVYNHLKDQGYRVFYSRESLRGKVGEKYEPYIFNALSTAKVMLVYGSSANYIMSTWIKNEWHRYYKRIVLGEKHPESLLVACNGFSPSELPKILSSRQCFDAKRITFLTDLDKHIKRIIQSSEAVKTPTTKVKEELLSGLHEHRYKTQIVKSSCIAKGYTVHKCSCGYEYKDTYTPLVDHAFKTTEHREPTCSSNGSETKVCEVCAEKQVNILPRLSHQYSRWSVQERASCTERGKSQRKCLICGEIETKELPAIGHNFGIGASSANNSTSSFCINCGKSKSEILSEEENYFNAGAPSFSSYNSDVISFFGILKNAFNYWKSFFTKQTTRMQKIKHWLGCSLILVFIFMFLSAGISSNKDTTPLYWIVIFILNIILLSCAYSGGEKEKKRYLEQQIPYPVLLKPRVGLKITSYVLLLYVSVGIALTQSNDVDDRYAGAMLSAVLVIWYVITRIYSHCPKECKKICFTRTSVPIHKAIICVIGAALTIVSIIVVGVCVGSTIQPRKYEAMLSYRESGENAEAYILCKELSGYEDADNIASELYPLVLQDAEKLYLSGEAAKAAALLERCGIDEKYEDYLYVSNGEYNKTSLSNIVIPNGTTHIASNAFRNNTKLTSVTIPDSVIDIGDSAFYLCDKLTSVNMGNGVMSIGNDAFLGCRSLVSIVIGDNVTTIGDGAFRACSLENITIPDSVVSIGNGAFTDCRALNNVIIPTSVTSIGSEAFISCVSLDSITIPESVVSIGYGAFSGCIALTNATILTGVTSISAMSFSNCFNLKTITIPESVVSIGEFAFLNCESLTDVIIPTSVTSICSRAFYNCNSLESVIIPKEVTNIGDEAFFNCKNLTSIKYRGTENQWSKINKGMQWDIYGPDLHMEHFKIPYAITYNYESE